MAGRNDDEDTKEQPGAPRYPDAAPAEPQRGLGGQPAEPSPTSGATSEAGTGAKQGSGWPTSQPSTSDTQQTVQWPAPPSGGASDWQQSHQPGTSEPQAGQGWSGSERWGAGQPAAGQQAADQEWPRPGQAADQAWSPPGQQQWTAPGQQQWSPPPSQAGWTPPPSGYPGQQYPGQQGYGGGQPGWAPSTGYYEPPYATSGMVVAAGIILLIFGLLLLLIGAVGVAAGSVIDQVLDQLGPLPPELEGVSPRALRDMFVLIFAIVLVLGILHLVSSIGVFLHKGWARIVAIVLAVLGTLFGVASLAGTLSPQAAAEGGLGFAILIALAYGFSLFALVAGGGHFRRRYST